MSERTFILAANRGDAIAWCRKNRVKPYAKSTIILTTVLACRGHEFREGDYAKYLGCSDKVIDEWQNVIASWNANQGDDYL